jgi:hypothetical protein
LEAIGQHVQQKAPDELVRVKPHRLPAARDAIVLPAERDAGIVGRNEPAVRNGDAMPVPGVPQHLLESANGTLQQTTH